MSFTRAIVFVVITYLVLVARATLTALLPWPAVSADLSLLIVLYLGFFGRGSTAAYVAVALVVGYLTDLVACSPRGLHALTLALFMLIARGASNRLLVANVWQTLVVTLASAIAHGALIISLTSSLYGSDAASALWLVPLTAVATCLAAPLIFPLLRRLDRKIEPDPRMRMAT